MRVKRREFWCEARQGPGRIRCWRGEREREAETEKDKEKKR
jgi:hypothetical protein